jgi:hypothetical protein
MKMTIKELDLLPESDKLIRCRERLEEFHIENMDWKAVLQDKWAIATLAQRGMN